MNKLVWTAPAVSDLESIRDYIARDSEIYADSILTVLHGAQKFPRG